MGGPNFDSGMEFATETGLKTGAELDDMIEKASFSAGTAILDQVTIEDDGAGVARVKAGGIGSSHIAADAIDDTHIQDDAIGAEHIQDDAIGADQLEDIPVSVDTESTYPTQTWHEVTVMSMVTAWGTDDNAVTNTQLHLEMADDGVGTNTVTLNKSQKSTPAVGGFVDNVSGVIPKGKFFRVQETGYNNLGVRVVQIGV